MNLTSSAFLHTQSIPQTYTCDGLNIHPPLTISDVPQHAQSLVLIVDDPDAPSGDWVHWTVWNILPDTKEILEKTLPLGAKEGMTDFGKTEYGGPCPSSGSHRYQFKLYALDVLLNLDSSARKKDIEKTMEGHVLAQGLLMGLYMRK